MIGVDSSEGMLEVARETRGARGRRARPAPRRPARAAGRGRVPARDHPVPLAAAHARPTRTGARRSAPSTRLLEPGGRFVFDVFTPSPEDIAETHGRWLQREPGIFERAEWDEDAPDGSSCASAASGAEAALSLAWLTVAEWGVLLVEEGFAVDAVYGWFDRAPLARPRGLDLGLPTRLS